MNRSDLPPCPRCELRHQVGSRGRRVARARRDTCALCGEAWDGRGWCRACRRQYAKGHHRRYGELSPAARRRSIAAAFLQVYIRRGKVKRARCACCRRRDTTGYQPDPARPLLVVWLCPRHREDVKTGRRALPLPA